MKLVILHRIPSTYRLSFRPVARCNYAMKIKWTNAKGETISARVDAHLVPYIEALGSERAAVFFTEFGGSYLYIPKAAVRDDSKLLRLLSREEICRLSLRLLESGMSGSILVPNGKAFLSRYFRSKGLSVNEIAMKLSLTHKTVRTHLLPREVHNQNLQNQSRRRLEAAIDEAIALGLVVRVQSNNSEDQY